MQSVEWELGLSVMKKKISVYSRYFISSDI